MKVRQIGLSALETESRMLVAKVAQEEEQGCSEDRVSVLQEGKASEIWGITTCVLLSKPFPTS